MKLFQVDAFTDQFFKGNPAGVCILDDLSDDRLYQNIALEMNLAETAFLKKENENEYQLRWFTPECEIEFCGHATLASAHLLWEKGFEKKETTIVFHTLAGRLTARRQDNEIELNFPSRPVQETKLSPTILNALNITPLFAGTDGRRYLIEIADASELRNMAPDYSLLKTAGKTAFTLTSRSDQPEYDFISRFFAPALGIDEDPVTGSAHSYLTPYWAMKLGKKIMTGYQASRRGGKVECEMLGNGRVLLRGQAVTVFIIDAAFGA